MSAKATASLRRRGHQISKANRLNGSEQRKLEVGWTKLEKTYKNRISKTDHYSSIIHKQLKDYEKETLNYYNDCKPFDDVYWQDMPDNYGDILQAQPRKHKQTKVTAPVYDKPLSAVVCEARLALSKIQDKRQTGFYHKAKNKRTSELQSAPVTGRSKSGKQKITRSDPIIPNQDSLTSRPKSSKHIVKTYTEDNELTHRTNNKEKDDVSTTTFVRPNMAPKSKTNNWNLTEKTTDQSDTSRLHIHMENYQNNHQDKHVFDEDTKFGDRENVNDNIDYGPVKTVGASADLDAIDAENVEPGDTESAQLLRHDTNILDISGSNPLNIKNHSNESTNIPEGFTDKHLTTEKGDLKNIYLPKREKISEGNEDKDTNDLPHKSDNENYNNTPTVESDTQQNSNDEVIQSEINKDIHFAHTVAPSKAQHSNRSIHSLNTISETGNTTNDPVTENARKINENHLPKLSMRGKWKAIAIKRGLVEQKPKAVTTETAPKQGSAKQMPKAIITETGNLVYEDNDDDDTSYKQIMINKWKAVTLSKIMRSNPDASATNVPISNGLTLPKLGPLGHGRRPSFARLASNHNEPDFEGDDVTMLQIKSLKF
ncbi:unnamed protein product [Owenia fusiformis]|uniref:Uncharacterized protein n=1 Tax=Owenia fusiformis TaxID=6347 RepID=A0A8J1TFI2_OWEFU|nr:unnamed protein product [Owenia fusiformis]